MSGIIEGTATAFANTWKTQASCPNIQHSFENPCALSIDNGVYLEFFLGFFLPIPEENTSVGKQS